jgi:hypothetical protein
MIRNCLHKIKKFSHNLFFPFDKIIEIIIIGENENDCNQFTDMCKDFITNGGLVQYGLEYNYSTKDDIFEIKIEEQNIVKFRFFYKTLLANEWLKENITIDILIPIFRLDKYQSFDDNYSVREINNFLGKVEHSGMTAITALINFDYLCENPISNVGQWENSINKIYDTLYQNKILDEENTNINENGREILNDIFAIFQRILNRNSKYTACKICNFFCCNEMIGFSFGKEEFFSNLLLRLLSLDKLNNYSYLIKKNI